MDPMEASMEAEAEVVRVARRVYVGNLAWRTSWQDLKDFFGRVGTVRYADVMREAGPGSRSKGCGIVEFETPEEAAAAIADLNNTDLDGRLIFVREDREDYELRGESTEPRRPNPSSGRGRARGPTTAVSVGRRVYVSNLTFETTWQQLKDHFKSAGRVLHADVLEDSSGRSRGCGIVEFDAPADALRAISLLSNSMLEGRQISVREDREDPAVAAAGAPRGGSRGPPAGSAGGAASAVGPGGATQVWRDGDWTCASCNSHNFAARASCFRCGGERS